MSTFNGYCLCEIVNNNETFTGVGVQWRLLNT